jgi:threonine dehydrogenase-like Zn-dependent dehydrogenase
MKEAINLAPRRMEIQEVSLPVIDFTRKEVNILGSRNSADIFGDAFALVQPHRDRVRRLITHWIPLEQAAPALEFALEHPWEVAKVIILLGDGS